MELITTKSIGGDREGCPSSVILNDKKCYLGYIGGIYYSVFGGLYGLYGDYIYGIIEILLGIILLSLLGLYGG